MVGLFDRADFQPSKDRHCWLRRRSARCLSATLIPSPMPGADDQPIARGTQLLYVIWTLYAKCGGT